MKYYEAKEFITTDFIALLHDRLLEIWPDLFVHNTTEDATAYRNSNGVMYNWYVHLVNGLYRSVGEPSLNYRALHDSDPNNHPHVMQMYHDFKTLSKENMLKWLIENVPIDKQY